MKPVTQRFLPLILIICWSSPAQSGKLPPGVEIRAYLNDTCIVSDEPYFLPPVETDQVSRDLGLSGVIVGKAAYALLNGLFKVTASGMENLSKQKDLHYVSAYDFELYRASLSESPEYMLNDRLSCVTVVAAEFEPAGNDCSYRYVPKEIQPAASGNDDLDALVVREERSVENVLRRANVCVDGAAHSVFEGRLHFSDDGTAFKIQGSGLWLNSLLGTNSRRAERSVVYMFDISEPGPESKPRTVLSAAVPIGKLRSATTLEGAQMTAESDWLQVPPMSSRAAQAYERDTAIHQDVHAEIQSLERSITRNKRLIDGLRSRMQDASENVQASMQNEIEGLDFKVQRMEALLDARRAEYDDLPGFERHYMPVTIGVGVIESRNQKRALATVAGFLDDHRVTIADTASWAMGIQRSLEGLDGDGIGVRQTPLEGARTWYFDTWAEMQEAQIDGGDTAALEDELIRAKTAYNEQRALMGIPAID